MERAWSARSNQFLSSRTASSPAAAKALSVRDLSRFSLCFRWERVGSRSSVTLIRTTPWHARGVPDCGGTPPGTGRGRAAAETEAHCRALQLWSCPASPHCIGPAWSPRGLGARGRSECRRCRCGRAEVQAAANPCFRMSLIPEAQHQLAPLQRGRQLAADGRILRVPAPTHIQYRCAR